MNLNQINYYEFVESYYKLPDSIKLSYLLNTRNKYLSGELRLNKITRHINFLDFIDKELKFLKDYPAPEIKFNSFDLIPFEPFNN